MRQIVAKYRGASYWRKRRQLPVAPFRVALCPLWLIFTTKDTSKQEGRRQRRRRRRARQRDLDDRGHQLRHTMRTMIVASRLSSRSASMIGQRMGGFDDHARAFASGAVHSHSSSSWLEALEGPGGPSTIASAFPRRRRGRETRCWVEQASGRSGAASRGGETGGLPLPRASSKANGSAMLNTAFTCLCVRSAPSATVLAERAWPTTSKSAAERSSG